MQHLLVYLQLAPHNFNSYYYDIPYIIRLHIRLMLSGTALKGL